VLDALADERAKAVLDDLYAEGMIERSNTHYKLPGA
jgi:hypothetical protein